MFVQSHVIYVGLTFLAGASEYLTHSAPRSEHFYLLYILYKCVEISDLGESRNIKEKLTKTLRSVLPEALLSLGEEEDGSEKHVAGFSDELCNQH